MKVREILKSKAHAEVFTTKPDTQLSEAMAMLINNRISCLPVIGESEKLAGIISDKDIFRVVFDHPNDFGSHTVSSAMSTNLIVGIENDGLDYIASLMTNNRIRHIPIVDHDKLIGLVSVGDIVKAQIEDMQVENRYLKQYIMGNYPG